MSVTIELLDALKDRNGGLSDYACRRILDVTQQTVSKYRTGDTSMSEEKVILVCEILQIDPTPFVIRLASERAKCDKAREVWNHALERLAA